MESAEPDLKSSQVTVKGVFDPEKLVEYVYKRTGKHAAIVKQEQEKKEKDKEDAKDGKKEEKKGEEGGGDKGNAKGGEEDKKEKKEGNEAKGESAGAVTEEEINKVVELQKNAYQYYPQRYAMEMYAYPPQIFSDENPNACAVM